MTGTVEQEESTLLSECRRLVNERRQPLRRVSMLLVAVAVGAGVALRFWAPTSLWLDEAISVNIARLPLSQIPRALSHDGAPPLYYVVLHFWIALFGKSDFAVRALSGVVSVATLPLFWSAGRRLGAHLGQGRTTMTAWAAFLLGVSSPFAIFYATTARMYSFMILWSLLGFLVLDRAMEDPSPRRLAALGAVTAAILYTHYWGLYFVALTALWLLYRIVRDGTGSPILPHERGMRPAFAAIIMGCVAWLPWAPVFVYQTLHTGTPWTGAAGPADLLSVFGDFGGSGPWGLLLTFLLFSLIVVGTFGYPAGSGDRGGARDGRAAGGALVMLGSRPRAEVRIIAGGVFGTLLIAVLAGAVAQAAFVARYAAVVLPLFLLLVAAGLSLFAGRRIGVGILVLACVAGLLTGKGMNSQQRTEATRVAAVLNVQAQPGDVVVYCPDQLGPAVDRLLHVRGVTQLSFPRAIGPQRVDWVNYRSVLSHTDVGGFAQLVLSRLGPGHNLWLAWRDGYPGLGASCGYLRSWLDLLRPTGETVVAQNGGGYYEYENLVRYAG